jgi:hypothetical protein
MMVLYHLMNPDAPKFLPMCCACNREINGGWKYTCAHCEEEYSMCPVSRLPYQLLLEMHPRVEGGRLVSHDASLPLVSLQGCYEEGYWRNHQHPLQRMLIRSKAAESNEPDMLRQKE